MATPDMDLRRFGFVIESRPAKGPVRWRDRRLDVVMDEKDAVAKMAGLLKQQEKAKPVAESPVAKKRLFR